MHRDNVQLIPSRRWLLVLCVLLGGPLRVAAGDDGCIDPDGTSTEMPCDTVELQAAPPVEPPAFLARLPKYELKLDTLTGCGLIDSASIGPGANMFGLRIGRDSLEEVTAKLGQQGARFKTDLGYRGYREDLPIAIVEALPAAQSSGALTQAWLRFNSLRVLYRLTFLWEDEAALPGVQALIAKEMPELAARCAAQHGRCRVEQSGVSLELHALPGRVTLSIASIPLDQEARNTEKSIDADIRRRRVGSARND